MTYPSSGLSNQWGFYDPNVSYQPPLGDGVAPPTGNLAPAQSPSGSVTGQSATFNFDESETSTEWYLSEELQPESEQQGVTALTSAPTIAGCPSVQINNWNSGAVGSVGNKFS